MDKCVRGKCFNKPKDCDDEDRCTIDSCNKKTGDCVNVPNIYIPGCRPSPSPEHCPKSCDDYDLCTDDHCDKETKKCVHIRKDCNDYDPCTKDLCIFGKCKNLPIKNKYGCGGEVSPSPKPSHHPVPSVDHDDDCPLSLNISAKHRESFDIECGGGERGKKDQNFLFKYCVSKHENSAVILGFDPFDKCAIGARGNCDNRAKDETTKNLCDFFDPSYPLAPGWKSFMKKDKICFVANFTIPELKQCRAHDDDYTPLITKNKKHDDKIVFSGQLHATTASGKKCHFPGHCVDIKIKSIYDFDLNIDASGKAVAKFFKIGLGFEARWVKTIWLNNGNVLIFIDTCVNLEKKGFDHGKQLLQLVNPAVNKSAETGRPVDFVNTEAECVNFHLPDKCCQRWKLITSDGSGSGKVDGLKPLSFDLFFKDKTRVPVFIFFDVGISRSPQKLWKGGCLDTKLQLFRDRGFTDLYDPRGGGGGKKGKRHESFIDCETVYGLLSTDGLGDHFFLSLEKVRLCIPTTGKPIPFDPKNPDTTGCNTPGVGMEFVQLFDRSIMFSNEDFNFEELFNPPSGPYLRGFSFQAKPMSNYLFLVEVDWKIKSIHSHISSSSSSSAVSATVGSEEEEDQHVEFFMDEEGDYDETYSSMGRGYGGLYVSCPHEKFFDHKSRSCKHGRGHGDSDSDDDDDHHHRRTKKNPRGHWDNDDDDDDDYGSWHHGGSHNSPSRHDSSFFRTHSLKNLSPFSTIHGINPWFNEHGHFLGHPHWHWGGFIFFCVILGLLILCLCYGTNFWGTYFLYDHHNNHHHTTTTAATVSHHHHHTHHNEPHYTSHWGGDSRVVEESSSGCYENPTDHNQFPRVDIERNSRHNSKYY